MLAKLTPQQFTEWMAAYNLEPWGDDWAQAGTIAAAIGNYSGNLKEPLSPADFVPGGEPRQEGLSDQQLKDKYSKYGAR